MSVSVVIVTYNSAGRIDRCLEAVAGVRPGLKEVIVVDNASGDDSAKLAEQHPVVRVIRNSRNTGFAGAANLGAKACHGDFLLFLNPDTEIHADCPTRLCKAFQDDGVGIAGCKIHEDDGVTLQHVGAILCDNALTAHLGRGEKDQGQFESLCSVPYVSGSALMIRRSVWESVGRFDERFWPAYFEDADLCWRTRARGLDVVVEPRAVLKHLEGGSSWKWAEARPGCRRPGRAFYEAYHANRLRFVLKHYSASELLRRFVPAELAWMVRRGPKGHFGALAKAYLTVLSRLRFRL